MKHKLRWVLVVYGAVPRSVPSIPADAVTVWSDEVILPDPSGYVTEVFRREWPREYREDSPQVCLFPVPTPQVG